jgi:predicted nicotinamide N-methyase
MMPAPPSQALLDRLAPLRRAPVGSCPLWLHTATDLFALWDAWEAETGGPCPPPFWGVLWPAAQALTQYLSSGALELGGKTVLDLGCGGALAAIAARAAGAFRVTANDVDRAALTVAAANAHANGVELELEPRDLTRVEPWPHHDIVLVADLFYERDSSHALRPKLLAARKAGALVLLADAGRPFFSCPGGVLVQEQRLRVDPEIEGTAERLARVYVL